MTRRIFISFLLFESLFLSSFNLYSTRIWANPLIEAAKKEGEIVFYGTLEVSLSQRIASLFEKNYPFIRTNTIRLGSERLAARVLAEGRAKSVKADVIHIAEMDFYDLLKRGLIEPYESPERAAFRPQYKDEKGFWTANSETLHVIAYNTNFVKGADIPKSFADLLLPKWKGKILIDENESKWMAGMMSVWGEQKTLVFLRKLAAQEVRTIGGHSQMQTLLAAGDAAFVAAATVRGPESLKRQGAPVDWVAVEPLISRQFVVALLKGAPHPNAGKLYLDSLLSKEAQHELANVGYNTGRSDFEAAILQKIPTNVKVVPVRSEMGDRYNEYSELYRSVIGIK